jgi:hypothetical protein
VFDILLCCWTRNGDSLDGTFITGMHRDATKFGIGFARDRLPNENSLLPVLDTDLICSLVPLSNTKFHQASGLWNKQSAESKRATGTSTR